MPLIRACGAGGILVPEQDRDPRPREAILRARLDRAKLLRATTNQSVAIVAKKSVFGSQEYFVRLFHRRTGLTPRSFRNERRMPARSGIAK